MNLSQSQLASTSTKYKPIIIMPLSAPQAIAFWTEQAQMALPDRTRLKLAAEGLTTPTDFIDFPEKEDLEALVLKCLKPAKIAGNLVNAPLREVLQYAIPARSEVRLNCARLIVKYYSSVGRVVEADDMFWPVLKNFMEHWKAMKEKKSAPVGIPPKLLKELAVHKWVEQFAQDLEEVYGARNAPLTYLTRPDVATPANTANAPRAVDQPYADAFASIQEEMKFCLSHTHNLQKADNATLFHRIDTAVAGHDVFATIAPYRRTQDGRGAWMAINSIHAGRYIYDKIVKDAMHVLTVRKWTGTASITLAQHIGAHRKAFIALTDASGHTPTEIPNPRQRVTYVLTSIETVDPKVLAAMAAVELDATNMRINFESLAVYMLPHCPVAAKHGKKNSLGAKISGAAGNVLTGKKGKTGVTLCYHEPKLFHKLPKDQKAELSEWNKNNRVNGGKRKGGPPGQENGRRVKARIANEQIAAMTASHTAELAVMKAMLEMTGVSTPAEAVIKPSVGAAVGFVPAPSLLLPGLVEQARIASVNLQSILKKKSAKSAAP